MNLQPIALPPAVSTHNRPKAAAVRHHLRFPLIVVSTHNRPKAAAFVPHLLLNKTVSFNTQPPEGGCSILCRRFLIQ